MLDFTAADHAAATPELAALLVLLRPQLATMAESLQGFRAQSPTPERTAAFEKDLSATLRDCGLRIVEQEYNRVEPAEREDCPLRIALPGQEYRRRPKSPNGIATLFGEFELRRYLYEAVDAGEPSLFPLELQLGVEAGLATPALAERVGLWSAEHEQSQVLDLLRQEHGVCWSAKSLRKVTAALCDGLAPFREDAQVARVLEMLQQAFDAKGRHRPTLVAGRDGIHVPIRRDGYHEAAAMTLTVMDRRGKRVGTVYLGQMPEPGQETASTKLTALLSRVLKEWHGRGRLAPRLAYVTDGGHHPKDYYLRVLRRLDDPWRAGKKLAWQWVLDFWHACGYLQDIAESLFGAGARADATFRKWRRWLRDRRGGITEVLRSAMGHYNTGPARSRSAETEYWKDYRFLRKHAVWMKYADYRRQRLPIGSGVTEAACKTLFAERLKRSGMTWGGPGGQVIVDLRVLVLSRTWQATYRAYLRSRPLPAIVKPASKGLPRRSNAKRAA